MCGELRPAEHFTVADTAQEAYQGAYAACVGSEGSLISLAIRQALVMTVEAGCKPRAETRSS